MRARKRIAFGGATRQKSGILTIFGPILAFGPPLWAFGPSLRGPSAYTRDACDRTPAVRAHKHIEFVGATRQKSGIFTKFGPILAFGPPLWAFSPSLRGPLAHTRDARDRTTAMRARKHIHETINQFRIPS